MKLFVALQFLLLLLLLGSCFHVFAHSITICNFRTVGNLDVPVHNGVSWYHLSLKPYLGAEGTMTDDFNSGAFGAGFFRADLSAGAGADAGTFDGDKWKSAGLLAIRGRGFGSRWPGLCDARQTEQTRTERNNLRGSLADQVDHQERTSSL
jgi:hypothetical protein